jgi:hypothetical protein
VQEPPHGIGNGRPAVSRPGGWFQQLDFRCACGPQGLLGRFNRTLNQGGDLGCRHAAARAQRHQENRVSVSSANAHSVGLPMTGVRLYTVVLSVN